ncbi:MAG TPA: OmpH family outer membrane protein [Gammaproteobacteria bacterium]
MLEKFRTPRIFALLAVLVAAPAAAQDLKIGYVNFELLVRESPQYEQSAATLRTEAARIESEIMTMQQRLDEARQRLERDASVLSQQERADLEREVRDLARDVQRAIEEGRQDLSIRENEELDRIGRLVLEAIQAYGRSESYDLILRAAAYVDEDLDVTDAILETLREDED